MKMAEGEEKILLEVITRSFEGTFNTGKKLGKLLKQGDVVAFFGELGAGKTVFAQGIARGLGIEEYVTSPTFTIINQYRGTLPLYHFDVYRLEDPREILELGYEEYFYGEGITVIEWAEKIKDYLPPDYMAVYIYKAHTDNDNYNEGNTPGPEKRCIIFQPRGKSYAEQVEELKKYVGSGH